MDYTKLTDDETRDILRQHDEVDADAFAELEQYIEDPANVLYWLDADGDFEQAVRIQGLPMETPMKVARGLNDTDYDFLAHTVATAEVDDRTCAGCGSTLYEFEFNATGSSWSDSFWISEWGDHMYQEMEFLSDPAAPPYWQADPDGPMIACRGCHIDGIVDRHRYGGGMLRKDTGEYALRGFDGATDRLTQYTVGGDCGTVVRDDWYWFSMDDREDIWQPLGEVFPFDEREFLLDYTRGRGDTKERLAEYDYVIVDVDDVVSFSQQPAMPDTVTLRSGGYGSTDTKALTGILEGWANATEPHPDLPFRHLIDKGSDVFVHEDNADEVRLELLTQTLRERKRTKGRKDAAHLLERYRFVDAVETDEYAELELPTGDVLISDWQGDNTFLPYVEKLSTHFAPALDSTDRSVIADEIGEAIQQELGVAVFHIGWDEGNEVFYPDMERPESKPVTGER